MVQTCTPNDGQLPNNRKSQNEIDEHTNYVSGDGLVEVVTTKGRKFPQHDYEIVVLRVRPRTGTRIIQLDQDQGLEILLSHREVGAFLGALNAADGKAQYAWRDIPEKPESRKAFWRRINQARHMRKGT